MYLEHTEPRNCPVSIDYPGEWVYGSGDVWLRNILYFGTAYIRAYDSDNTLRGWYFDNFKLDPGTEDYRAQLSVSWPAASGSLFHDKLRYELEGDPYPWASLQIDYADCPLCMNPGGP